MVSIERLLDLLDSLSSGTWATLNGLKVDDCSLVQVIELSLMPVCFRVAEALLLSSSLTVYHRDVIFEILQRKIQLKIVILLLSSRRHRIVWIIERSESLVHGLRRRTNGFETRKSLLMLLL